MACFRFAALTFTGAEAAIVAYWTEIFKDEDSHCNNGEAHDKHHHPDSGAVGLCGKRNMDHSGGVPEFSESWGLVGESGELEPIESLLKE